MELKDRVEQISALIRELREATGDGPRVRQLIDSIFRSVHSFKAAASADGLNDLSRTAHELENLLHSLRTGRVKLTEDVLRLLEESTASWLSGRYVPVLEGLSRTSAEDIVDSDQLPTDFENLKDEERHRASEAIREGSNLYVMEVVFDTDDFDRRFRELKQQLEKTSEIISTSARMEEAKVNFRVLYAAKSAKIPVHTVFQQARRAGEAAAANLGKKVEFVVRGEKLLLERTLSDPLADCLLHLVRNAVDHGIELQGTIVLEATTTSGQTRITVTDDGRGIDPTKLSQIFQPGFSTASNVTELSGRGVGLDVVATTIKELGGSVSVTSERGKGATFALTLPRD